MCKKTTLLAAAAAVTMGVFVVVVRLVAQVPPGAEGGGFFPVAGQGSGFVDVQARIRASDEEWKVIGPKLSRAIAAYASVAAAVEEPTTGEAGFMPMGPSGSEERGRGPRGGPGNDSFAGPGEGGPFGRGGPGPEGFGPGEFGRGGRGDPGPDGFGPRGFGSGGRGRGGSGRGGPGGPPGFGGPGGNAVMQKLMELQTTLADPNATSDQIKEKTAVVRNARQKAKVEWAAARKDLLQLLTLDQEATLVSLGYLD